MFKTKEKLENLLLIIILVTILIILLPIEIIKGITVFTLVTSIIYLLRLYIAKRLYSTLNHYLKINNYDQAIICAIKHDNILNLRNYRILSKIALAKSYYNLGDFNKSFDNLKNIELREYDNKYIKGLYCYEVAELNCLLGKDKEIVTFYEENEKQINDLRNYLVLKSEKIEFDNTLLFINTYIKIINKNKLTATSIINDLEDDWSINEKDKRNYKILKNKLKKLK